MKNEFHKTSGIILKNSKNTKSDKSFSEKVTSGFSNLVHIRKVVADEGSLKSEDVLARSNSAIESGNFSKALTELNSLPSTDKQQLSGWITKVKTYISIQEASESIFKYVTKDRTA